MPKRGAGCPTHQAHQALRPIGQARGACGRPPICRGQTRARGLGQRGGRRHLSGRLRLLRRGVHEGCTRRPIHRGSAPPALGGALCSGATGFGLWLDRTPDRDWGWLRTAGLPGLSAVHPRWLASPTVAVRAIGAGLRMLHDRLPVRSCPFDWSAAGRLSALAPAVRARLGEPPPVDQLVVCRDFSDGWKPSASFTPRLRRVGPVQP